MCFFEIQKPIFNISRNDSDVFRTPMTTPTRMRRSISTGDVSIQPSPILRTGREKEEKSEVESLKERISDLELQLEDALQKLVAKESVVISCAQEKEMTARIEQLEAEMESYRAELKLREEERVESEKLAEQIDNLQVRGEVDV